MLIPNLSVYGLFFLGISHENIVCLTNITHAMRKHHNTWKKLLICSNDYCYDLGVECRVFPGQLTPGTSTQHCHFSGMEQFQLESTCACFRFVDAAKATMNLFEFLITYFSYC